MEPSPVRQSRLTRFAPGVAALGDYQRSGFRPDLLVGVTVWAMLVPQALGYSSPGRHAAGSEE